MSSVACVGLGVIGAAWAQAFCAAGFEVRLHDREAGRARDVALDLERDGRCRGRVRVCETLDEVATGTDYLQESIVEDVAAKRELYARIDALSDRPTWLGSSSSEFGVSTFAAGLGISPRCLVAHPINPPSILPLVELCPGPETSADAVSAVGDILRRAGRHPVTVLAETPGFILNRLQAAVLNEAWSLVERGLCTPADIDDTLVHGLGLRWAVAGPFMAGHLNAPGGYADYMERYGHTWRRIVADLAGPAMPGGALIEQIDASCRARLDGRSVAEGQKERDSILRKVHAVQTACIGPRDRAVA